MEFLTCDGCEDEDNKKLCESRFLYNKLSYVRILIGSRL